MLRGFLRVLCELCVQTSYFFTGCEGGHYVYVLFATCCSRSVALADEAALRKSRSGFPPPLRLFGGGATARPSRSAKREGWQPDRQGLSDARKPAISAGFDGRAARKDRPSGLLVKTSPEEDLEPGHRSGLLFRLEICPRLVQPIHEMVPRSNPRELGSLKEVILQWQTQK